MRIIHYIPSLDRTAGGTSTYMQILAKALGNIAELHIITHRSPFPLALKNCQVHVIPRWKPISSSWRKTVMTLIRGIHPDIVHINCCWLPDCSAIQRLAQGLGYSVVLTPHGMLEPWIIRRHYLTRKLPALWLYQKAAIQKANIIHATADSEQENLMRLGYNQNIKVVKLGIDVGSIKIRESWAKTRQILFLSRIHVKKGIDYLIEATYALRNELRGYRIMIAGEGDAEYIASLKRQISTYGINDIIEFTGGVYGETKWELYRTSDFFVLPTHSENFGLAIAESLASGTPVITTVGTPWKELSTSNAGACIEIGAQHLVETLRKFIRISDSEREEMGRNGRSLIENKYSDTKMANEMMALYNSIL